MANSSIHSLLLLSVFLPFGFFSISSSSSVHELLRSRGLPAGLIPKDVKSYTLSDNGRLEVFLDGPCLAKFENRVIFDSVVKANLSYGGLIGVQGLSQEELFLWLPVKDIIVDDPNSGLILFDIGVAHKQFSLSLFEDPPDCEPRGGLVRSIRERRREVMGRTEMMKKRTAAKPANAFLVAAISDRTT